MDWKNGLRFFGNKFQNPVTLIIIGLVGLEKIVDIDFVCPCSDGYKKHIFWLYLLIPMITTFIVTFYLASKPHGGEKNEKNKRRAPYLKSSNCFCCELKFWISLFSSLIWVVLFFADGRYMACLSGQQNDRDENACKKTDYSYHVFLSKIIGLYLMLLLSLVALLLKCCHKYFHRPSSPICKVCQVCCEELCDENCKEFYTEATLKEVKMFNEIEMLNMQTQTEADL